MYSCTTKHFYLLWSFQLQRWTSFEIDKQTPFVRKRMEKLRVIREQLYKWEHNCRPLLFRTLSRRRPPPTKPTIIAIEERILLLSWATFKCTNDIIFSSSQLNGWEAAINSVITYIGTRLLASSYNASTSTSPPSIVHFYNSRLKSVFVCPKRNNPNEGMAPADYNPSPE